MSTFDENEEVRRRRSQRELAQAQEELRVAETIDGCWNWE